MKRMRVILIIGSSLILLAAFYALISRVRSKTVIDSWETSNNAFSILVTAYNEKSSLQLLSGAYYKFQSSIKGSTKWNEVMVFRHDDIVPVPKSQIRFVSNQVGDIFMGWMYAVTTDGGNSWSVWNAENDLPNWECCNYKLIKDISLSSTGIGMMTLSPISGRRGEVPVLHTKDYGRHWGME